ncbi:MAG: hypothetical protein U7127_11235 [Phormidium sp.]
MSEELTTASIPITSSDEIFYEPSTNPLDTTSSQTVVEPSTTTSNTTDYPISGTVTKVSTINFTSSQTVVKPIVKPSTTTSNTTDYPTSGTLVITSTPTSLDPTNTEEISQPSILNYNTAGKLNILKGFSLEQYGDTYAINSLSLSLQELENRAIANSPTDRHDDRMASLYNEFLKIADKPAAERTSNENFALDWLSNQIKTARVQSKQVSFDEYYKWKKNPSLYKAPAGFPEYDAPSNYSGLTAMFSFPKAPPVRDYGIGLGLTGLQTSILSDGTARVLGRQQQDIQQYQDLNSPSSGLSFSDITNISSATGFLGGAVIGGSIGTTATGAALGNVLFPFAGRVAQTLMDAVSSAAATTSATTNAVVGGFKALSLASKFLRFAGPAATIVSAIIDAVMIAIQVTEDANLPGELQAELDSAKNAPPPNIGELMQQDSGATEIFSALLRLGAVESDVTPANVLYDNNNGHYLSYSSGDATIYGRGGDDNISSGLGNDWLDGGTDNDILRSGDGNDTLDGAAGNDNLSGETGDDLLYGWAGSDALYGGIGNDSVYGEADSDLLFGGEGNDFLNGGDGDDFLKGEAGNDLLYGGNGNDALEGYDGNDVILAGKGDDALNGGAGKDLLVGQDGFDGVNYAGTYTEYEVSILDNGSIQLVDKNPANGDEGTDTLSDVEYINFAGGGTYRVNTGSADNDVLTANPSYVTLMFGGAGNDTITGAPGSDTLAGGAGNDLIRGGTANDVAAYQGNFSEYRVSVLNNGALQIFDQNTLNGDEGTDTLTEIEQLKFANGSGSVSQVITGSALGDVLTANANGSLISGGAGKDNIVGGAGNDILGGDADNDTIAGSAGDDLIEGGTGEDFATYQGIYNEYKVSLLSNGNVEIVDRNPTNGNEGTDILSDIEQINFANGAMYRVVAGGAANDVLNASFVWSLMFGGTGNDNITGGSGQDTIAGGADNDTLASGVGNDSIDGGTGNDSIDGGTGQDFAAYQGAYSDYDVSILSNGNIQLVDQNPDNGDEGTDILSGIEQINFANGAMYRVVTGSAANDVLSTNPVWSLMSGGAGNDSITGASDSDTLAGGEDNDTLAGGAGNDSIDGGSGFDRAVLQGHYTDYAVSILSNGNIQLVDQNPANGNEGTDTLSGIEQIDFVGGGIYRVNTGDAANNVLSANPSYVALMFGGAGNDNITGAPGSDTLAGGSGDDTLAGGAGNDSIDGGTGNDVAVYQGVYTDYAVSILSNGNIQLVDQNPANGNEGTDTLSGIEQIDFVGGGIYRVNTGDAANNVLSADPSYVALMSGGAGNDNITGASDSDTLAGGSGDDTLAGGAGNDSIDGGSGFDRAVLQGHYTDYAVSILSNGNIQLVDQNPANGNEGTDTLSGIEQIDFVGGGIYRVNTGDAANNVLSADPSYVALMSGGAGNDNITGAPGSDTLAGGSGDDTLAGGAGNDSIDGGTGNDVAVYQGVYTDYAVSILSNGNIQLVDQNTANGNEGTDTLSGIEQIDFVGGGIYRVVTGSAANDVLSTNPVWSLMFGGAGNDSITGASDSDTLAGGDDNDTLAGGAGNDSIDGGSGFDRAVLQGHYTDYAVSILSNGNIQLVDQNTANGNEGTDTLSGIEQIDFVGGGIYRVNTGDAANNVLSANPSYVALMFGGAGNDNIMGAPGSDTLAGGDDNDTLAGGAGDDSITGGTGADRFVFNALPTGRRLSEDFGYITGEPSPEGIDRIADFKRSEGDKVLINGSTTGVTSTADFTFDFSTKTLRYQGMSMAIIPVANSTDFSVSSDLVIF